MGFPFFAPPTFRGTGFASSAVTKCLRKRCAPSTRLLGFP
jgi:hypothetical protein